ncbi:hypothetical protein L249_1384, partial [Ophiocordyceps polyrhachis-furcata BCC 54312]
MTPLCSGNCNGCSCSGCGVSLPPPPPPPRASFSQN